MHDTTIPENQTTFTPGPWRVDPSDAHEVLDESGELLATAYPMGNRDEEVTRANARLMAAAPDMLRALQSLQSNLETGHCTTKKCGDCGQEIGWPEHSFAAPICNDCMIAAAIAKAEGR